MKRAKMLHELGYNVFAVDIYGKGVRPSKLEKKKETSSYYYKNRPLMLKALAGALDFAKKINLPTNNPYLVGYCFGGTVGLEIARNTHSFARYYIFHGGLQTPDGQSYQSNKAKLYIYHGGADKAVSLQDVSQLGQELELAKQDYLIQIYSGAPHAFTHFGGERYRETADKESWKHMLEHM